MNEKAPANNEPKIIGFESQPLNTGMSFQETYKWVAVGVVSTFVLFYVAVMIGSEWMPEPNIGGFRDTDFKWAPGNDFKINHTPVRPSGQL